MVAVKICGVTTADDARACVDLGADAVGVNLVPGTPRVVERARAVEIARAVGGRVRVVAVVADLEGGLDALRELQDDVGWVQLHGDEPAETLAALLPRAYKAVRISGAEDAARAAGYPGEHLLVDAKVPGKIGGTGATFDWALARDLAAERKLLLAGGLTPDNVADAVRAVRPWAVDVASGVEKEGDPRAKDLARVAAFIARAKGA